jgi:hypothetical protein
MKLTLNETGQFNGKTYKRIRSPHTKSCEGCCFLPTCEGVLDEKHLKIFGGCLTSTNTEAGDTILVEVSKEGN